MNRPPAKTMNITLTLRNGDSATKALNTKLVSFRIFPDLPAFTGNWFRSANSSPASYPRSKELKSIYSSPYPLRLFPNAPRLHARSQNLIFRAVEDADLIARVHKGDIEGFNLLVSRWEKRVFNYLLRLTGNPDDSLDLSQDVFLKAYQNIRKLDDAARFGPWLFRIAHNEAYSGFRKRRPEADTEDTERMEREPARSVAPELTLAVSAALDRLNPEQREAVVLKVYQGFKFEEMAEILA